MSSNQRLTNRTAESDTRNQAGDKKSKGSGLDLSATQVVGGALAAMTAAALGFALLVAGCIVARRLPPACRWLVVHGFHPSYARQGEDRVLDRAAE